MYTVVVAKSAEKSLLSLSPKDQERVLSALEGLESDPFVGKKLQGHLEDLWTIRVMPFRIVYSINKKEVIVSVVAIGDRIDVYKKTKRRK